MIIGGGGGGRSGGGGGGGGGACECCEWTKEKLRRHNLLRITNPP